MIRMMGLVELKPVGAPVGSRTVDEDSEESTEEVVEYYGDDGYDAMRDRRGMGSTWNPGKRRAKEYEDRMIQRRLQAKAKSQQQAPKSTASKDSPQSIVVKWKDEKGDHEATIKSIYGNQETYPKGSPARRAADMAYAQFKRSQQKEEVLPTLNEENMDNPSVIDDHEGQMAKAQLMSIYKNSAAIYNMLGDNEELEGWVQSKLTKAAEYLNAVYNNMNYEKNKPGTLGDGEGTPSDQTADMEMNESAPEGWEGTVKAMKKHPEIDNPWAMAYYMKSKGYKSRKSVKEESEPTVKNPETGKEIKATSALSPDHPAYAAARRLLQGKKMSAGQRRGLKKLAKAAIAKNLQQPNTGN